MNPLWEIILRSSPSYILGKAPTYFGNCPLHGIGLNNDYLQFELAKGRIKMFCHACHYIPENSIADILAAWGLAEENLIVSREMNPQEAIYIEARANLIRLDLESRRLHGLEWNDAVRSQYLDLIKEKTNWVGKLDEYYKEGDKAKALQAEDVPF